MSNLIWSYQVVDAKGKKATAPFFMATPDTTTLTALHAEWVKLGNFLQAISDGKVSGGRVVINFAQDAAWKANPDADANIDTPGLFTFIQDQTVYRQSYVVPAIAEAVITNGHIDITDGDVQNFIDALVSGRGLSANFGGDGKYGASLTGFYSCVLPSRKHRKQSLKNTYVSGDNYVPGA